MMAIGTVGADNHLLPISADFAVDDAKLVEAAAEGLALLEVVRFQDRHTLAETQHFEATIAACKPTLRSRCSQFLERSGLGVDPRQIDFRSIHGVLHDPDRQG